MIPRGMSYDGAKIVIFTKALLKANLSCSANMEA